MKKFLSMLLALIMVVGMLPMSSFAATDLTWNGGKITLASGTKVGTFALTTLEIYKQNATSTYPTITSVTQDGNTINITLAEGTDPSYPLQMGFSGNGYVQNANNTCTLNKGEGTATVAVQAKAAPAPNAPVYGTGTFTVNFFVEVGEVYDVTTPIGEGFTFVGEAIVGKNQDYSFKVTANEGYDGSGMVVKVNGNEITESNGIYVVPEVNEDLIITVEGVVKKEVLSITAPVGEGFTFNGSDIVYKNEDYTFTISVDNAYNASDMVVKANGIELSGNNGKYTVVSVSEDTVITVEGIRLKTIYTVTLPEGVGYTVSGQSTSYAGEPYTFTVIVSPEYLSDAMVVKVNGEEVSLTNGKYTIPSLNADVTVEVSGVVKKPICEIIKPADGKFTFAGEDYAYKGNEYVFTVTPNIGYTATVTVNGEAVAGSGNTYTVQAEGDALTILVSTERESLPERNLPIVIKDDTYTVDVTDNKLNPRSSYHATVTDIKITGAKVTGAFESGTTVYFTLDSYTPDNASMTIEFLYTKDSCTLKGNTVSVELQDGEAGIKHTVTADYSNGWKTKSAEYTLVFFRDVPAAVPPVCIKNSDTKEVWKDRNLEIDLSEYFTDADSYYLINGDEKTAIEGEIYTFTSGVAGEHSLVFSAENEAGFSEHLTLTVNVKDIESGIYIGNITGNGSLNFVQFMDSEGELIEGIEVFYNTASRAISVVLPKNYSLSGKVNAKFDLTQSDGVPFITTKTGTSGTTSGKAVNNKFTEKSFTLNGGAASFTFYYYNTTPTTNSNNPQTWTLNFSIQNDLPVLKGATCEEVVLEAGAPYEIDLSQLFADADGDSLTYLVSVNGAQTLSADANYTFSAEVAGIYTLVFYANDGKGTSADTYTVTLTVENSTETDSMTVCVPDGLTPSFYVQSGFENGIDKLGDALDSIKGESSDGMTAYTINYPVNAEMISVRTENFGGMAFNAEKDGTVSLRKTQFKVVDYDNNDAVSTNKVTYSGNTAVAGSDGWLLVVGNEYVFTATPQNADLIAVSKTLTMEAGADIYIASIMLGIKNPMSITVPTGAKAQLYKFNQYYSNTELDAKIIIENDNGTTTYQFIADTKANGASYIYRVSMDGKITKAGWLKWGEQNIFVNYTDNDKEPSYRLDNYTATGESNSTITEDSVLLNINSRNHLNLSVGESKTLKAYRAWEIIPVSYNNYIIQPDFDFTILYGEDVVSLSEKASSSAGNSDWMTLTALKEGIAIIEVTYDAIQISGGTYDGVYGASDPARSGLLVVQVGENDDSSVKFGIECFASIGTSGSKNITYNPNKQKEWDSEFDTLYFLGNSGKLTLKPTASSDIADVSVSHDKGLTWKTLSGENGVYTAEIISGNNILRVKTLSGTAYQVVRGDRITVKFDEVSDKSNDNGIIEAGETIRVYLNGLHNPIPKMAGNYNPGYAGNYDGYNSQHLNYTCNGTAIYGTGAQYNFITAANFVEVVMPDDGSDITLCDGYIGLGVIGLKDFANNGDSHRNIPDGGCTTRGNETTYHTRSILPDITVSVGDTSAPNSAPVVRTDAVTEDEIYSDQNFAINPDTLFIDPDNDTMTFTVSVNGAEAVEAPLDYKFVPNGTGTYTLLFTATDGKEYSQHTITLTVTNRPSQGGGNTEADDEYGLSASEIAGYVTISFTDNGKRVKGETGLKYPKALGTIIASTKVPYKDGEKITHVTKRLLEHLGIRMEYTGTLERGFYLGAICNFELKGTPYDSMGEFDAGVGSGWMITLNKTFIEYGASEFTVKNGDVIKWQYTCQLGKDIGDPFYSGSSSSSSSNKKNKTEDEKKEDKEEAKEETVKNTFTETTFSDVKKDDWHYESVKYVYENNLMQGTDNGFEPESKMTRAMLVTVLYRMTNPENTENKHSFADVPEDEWYSDAVLWASENNIVSGVGENKFAPNEDITREQMALIIYRYARLQGIDVNNTADISSFTDTDAVSDWAFDAIKWANSAELVNGTSETALSPKDTATRAQVATILMRFNKELLK